ncbi:MAG: hypothetical protein HYU56_00275 [Candidatus Aenigmarchaeota archaeon]|nr:hypothetical protein [Candidatus Aenigmarchaeota archaeon]
MTQPNEVEEVVKAIAVHVKTELRTAKDEINRVNERIERRSKDIEDKIQLLENKILTDKTAAPKDIVSKISELEKKLAATHTASDTERMLDEKISRKLKEIEDRSSASKSDTDISDELADLRSRIESMKTSTGVSLSALEKKISSGGSKNAQNIESKIETLEAALNNLQKSQQELRKESAALVSIKKKLQDISGKHEIPSVIIDKLAEFENRVSSVSETVNADLGKISGLESKVMSIPEELESRLDEKLNERLSEIRSEISQKPSNQDPDGLADIRSQIEDIKNSNDEKLASFKNSNDENLASLESKLANEMQRLEEDMKHPAGVDDRTNEMVNKLEKMHTELEKRLADNAKTELPDMGKRIEFLEGEMKNLQKSEKRTEEEDVIISSIDKKMSDLEMFAKDTQANMGYIKSVEGKLDKAIDAKATRIFTKQLEDLSRIMDKRYPSLVTRDDLQKSISEIKRQLEAVESPNIAALAEQVDYLEKKVEATYNMLKNISNRIPVIVE